MAQINEMSGTCKHVWEGEDMHTEFSWGSVRKDRHRWEDTIKMDFQEVGGYMHWIDLTQDTDRWRSLVNTVMNLRFP